MKTPLCKSVLLGALIGGLGLMLAGRVTAQTFTTLHSFTNNSDGAAPSAGLLLSGNTLYGMVASGGSSHSYGTVFSINTNGGAYTILYRFSDLTKGGQPEGVLILSGNTLYGTASDGGDSLADNGTVFSINTNGTGITGLHSFTAADPSTGTNSDGASPYGGLVLSGSTLYGMASDGGSGGEGTVFALNTNGTGFTTLYSFTALSYNSGIEANTNDDGAHPYGGLVLSGSTLYGTAGGGGSWGSGTVFAVNTNGMGLSILHTFSALGIINTNSDGFGPSGGLVLSGNTLYGTAQGGGLYGNGTVFALNTNGSGFTTLYSFTAESGPSLQTNRDGSYVNGGLILSANTLYGTAQFGGSSGDGTVFSLSLGPATVSRPQLTILRSGANVILAWPTSVAGFTVQSTTNLSPPAVWTPVFPGPVVVGGQNIVTNAIAGTQQFYRLFEGP